MSEISTAADRPIRELLLVDDSLADVRLAREALRESGANFSMAAVHSGQEALTWLLKRAEHVTHDRPVLVLLDMNMPGWNGEATLKQIRQHAKIANTPVVFLTCNYEPDPKRADALGANGYVWKPDTLPGLTQFFQNLESFWYDHIVADATPPTEPATLR